MNIHIEYTDEYTHDYTSTHCHTAKTYNSIRFDMKAKSKFHNSLFGGFGKTMFCKVFINYETVKIIDLNLVASLFD